MEHWGWFLDNLFNALGDLNKRGTVIMSYRQKGLNQAIQEHLPLATEAHCCKHIGRNMLVVFGDKVKGLFWRLVYARIKEQWKSSEGPPQGNSTLLSLWRKADL